MGTVFVTGGSGFVGSRLITRLPADGHPVRAGRSYSWLYEHERGRFPRSGPAPDLCGRYWDRTSDLFGVNEALSR